MGWSDGGTTGVSDGLVTSKSTSDVALGSGAHGEDPPAAAVASALLAVAVSSSSSTLHTDLRSS
jgi:hypothetical protein